MSAVIMKKRKEEKQKDMILEDTHLPTAKTNLNCRERIFRKSTDINLYTQFNHSDENQINNSQDYNFRDLFDRGAPVAAVFAESFTGSSIVAPGWELPTGSVSSKPDPDDFL